MTHIFFHFDSLEFSLGRQHHTLPAWQKNVIELCQSSYCSSLHVHLFHSWINMTCNILIWIWPPKAMIEKPEITKVFSAPNDLWDEILDSIMSKEKGKSAAVYQHPNLTSNFNSEYCPDCWN
jgi:hypothetical protein